MTFALQVCEYGGGPVGPLVVVEAPDEEWAGSVARGLGSVIDDELACVVLEPLNG